MSFDPNVKLDPGQVTDRRGMPGGRGGLAIGGGGLGIAILLIYALLGGNPGDLGPLLEPGAVVGPESSALATDCRTGQDANERDDCRILGYVNSIQGYWTDAFTASGETYRPADTVLFSGAISSGCGTASAATGPFYCPPDELVYLDLDFFDELRTRFGAQGGSLAQGYVVAHEYGHHVQDLLGVLGSSGGGSGAEGQSVRIELQADCFAGVWANHADETGFLEPLTDAQIADAMDAAAAVGDDRIQEATQGQVDPDSWTHGSSAQRQQWFMAGYKTGDPAGCDTFNGEI
jgi:predicted metalloprotease